MNLHEAFINQSKEYMNKNIINKSYFNLSIFHPYFNITTESTLKKLLSIIYPYNQKSKHEIENNETTYTTKMHYIYNLELYIPIHSFITFLLIKIYLSNTIDIISKITVIEIIQNIITKILLYFYNISSIGILDIIAMNGYKYAYLTIIHILKMYNNTYKLFAKKYLWG
ncbi:YIF1 integral membrane protein, partial [Spraguea lophii 42_110]